MNGDEPLASRLTRVSDEPPTSFHEALQLIMLYYVAVQQADASENVWVFSISSSVILK